MFQTKCWCASRNLSFPFHKFFESLVAHIAILHHEVALCRAIHPSLFRVIWGVFADIAIKSQGISCCFGPYPGLVAFLSIRFPLGIRFAFDINVAMVKVFLFGCFASCPALLIRLLRKLVAWLLRWRGCFVVTSVNAVS